MHVSVTFMSALLDCEHHRYNNQAQRVSTRSHAAPGAVNSTRDEGGVLSYNIRHPTQSDYRRTLYSCEFFYDDARIYRRQIRIRRKSSVALFIGQKDDFLAIER